MKQLLKQQDLTPGKRYKFLEECCQCTVEIITAIPDDISCKVLRVCLKCKNMADISETASFIGIWLSIPIFINVKFQ